MTRKEVISEVRFETMFRPLFRAADFSFLVADPSLQSNCIAPEPRRATRNNNTVQASGQTPFCPPPGHAGRPKLLQNISQDEAAGPDDTQGFPLFSEGDRKMFR
jgi:hypothetical protein